MLFKKKIKIPCVLLGHYLNLPPTPVVNFDKNWKIRGRGVVFNAYFIYVRLR